MPKGVEHVIAQNLATVEAEVQEPLMPKGVEHSGKPVSPTKLAGAGASDAERR